MTDTEPSRPIIPPTYDERGVRDFSRPRKTHRFRIDSDYFDTIPAIPVDMAREMLRLRAEVLANPDDPAVQDRHMDFIVKTLDEILLPPSAARFAERMGSKTEPIDSVQLVEVVSYLMEELGERPTPPPGSSTPLPGPTGTTSMDGVPHVESIPTTSVSLAT